MRERLGWGGWVTAGLRSGHACRGGIMMAGDTSGRLKRSQLALRWNALVDERAHHLSQLVTVWVGGSQ